MRAFIIALWMLIPVVSFAEGSITWDEVSTRIRKTDPDIVKCICDHFIPDRVGWAARIGVRVDPERAGERIPPYDFEALRKTDSKRCRLQIVESGDFSFTGRYVFTATENADKK